MGVKSLWKLLTPVGRPVLLETLEGKALAIDSSIWIYQFQATMRDSDGHVILNAHVLGFLRRICKLLFWGIKPVFVFDGGAPTLKRSTINERRLKKEGAATTHAKVAERLLAAQMRREAVDQAQGRKSSSKGKSAAPANPVEDDDEAAVYLEDLDPSMPIGKPRSKAKPQGSTKPRFYDHDPYHLPDMSFESKIAEASRFALDPRLATAEEMDLFISEMAPSDFDLTSEAFRSLPTEVQYEIIGDLRLKSRQTSFKRLQNMLKNSETSLDFSMEQIKGLKERNRLTQQLLTTTDSIGKAHVEIPIRIAGERNREYILVKNEGEGKGWILGMRDVGTRDQPIIVDDPSRDGVKPKEARDREREEAESDDDTEMEEVRAPTKQPSPATIVPQDQDLRRHRSRMTLAAVAKRRKPFSRSVPVRARSGVFPRRPSGSRAGEKMVEPPLFIPDEEDDAIPQAVRGNEGDEWEDSDGELEEDVQMSIAIAESLESQHRPRRTSNTGPPMQTPIKSPRQVDINNHDKATTDDKDEFVSPSRLATQLSIAGARKPLSTRTPSDSVRGTLPLVTSTPSVSSKSTQSLVAIPTLGRPSNDPVQGATDEESESEADDDMEEVSIPQVTGNRLHTSAEPALEPPEPAVNPGPDPVTENVETPLAIGVEDVVAKRFAEFQKIIAEKRRTFQAEKPEVQEETQQTREVLSAESPGLEYADDQVEVIEVQEKEKEAMEVRSSPPPQSDEDEDMEEVEVVAAPLSVPSRVSRSSVQSELSFQPPPSIAAVTGALLPKNLGDSADREDEEDVPISDWSRSPSPGPRPLAGEADPPTSAPTLDRSRGLLDPDDSLDQGPSGDQDQEHEDFDAAREMDPDAEAGEFARWISQVKGRNLDDVRKEIEQEINGLRKERKAAMRDSEDITGQMIAQIMMMLRLFGIPYITAPMEAEAQCAELVHLGLVEGVITDDSDVFLFGGNRVFRNMFNQSKTVECFLSSDLFRELGLDRGTLVRLAYLLGSDYTEGLPGVGPVVAMELIKEFPGEDGLEKFAQWWRKVQSGRDKKDESASKFRKSFKKKFKALYLGEDWPNSAVRDAYYQPTVDSSEEPFKWGLPDLDGLRGILQEELGWSQQKSDELLLPVIQRVNRRGAAAAANKQSNLDAYFGDSIGSVGVSALPRKRQAYTSKRLQKVVTDYREEQKKRSRTTAKGDSSTLSNPDRSGDQYTEEKDTDEDLLADFGEDLDVDGEGDQRSGSMTKTGTGKTSKPTTTTGTAAPTKRKAAGEKRKARKSSENITSTTSRSAKRKKRANDSDEYDDEYPNVDEVVPVLRRPRPKPVHKKPNPGAGSKTTDQERGG